MLSQKDMRLVWHDLSLVAPRLSAVNTFLSKCSQNICLKFVLKFDQTLESTPFQNCDIYLSSISGSSLVVQDFLDDSPIIYLNSPSTVGGNLAAPEDVNS